MPARVQALACHCSLKAVRQPKLLTGRGIQRNGFRFPTVDHLSYFGWALWALLVWQSMQMFRGCTL